MQEQERKGMLVVVIGGMIEALKKVTNFALMLLFVALIGTIAIITVFGNTEFCREKIPFLYCMTHRNKSSLIEKDGKIYEVSYNSKCECDTVVYKKEAE